MAASEVDLASLFSAVTKTLQENQASLNEADEYNHDHGDNMVNNFKLITRAVKKKKGASPSEQLAYASQTLQKKSSSGSARLYSQGLSQAASKMQGQDTVTSRNALDLVQALLGGQSSSQSGSGDLLGQLAGSLLAGGATNQPVDQPRPEQGSDMLGGLLGSLMGGTGAGQPGSQPAGTQGADLLGGLLGSLMGAGAGGIPTQSMPDDQPAGGGLDLNTMLGLASALMGPGQQGGSAVQTVVNSLLSSSQVNDSPHHSQSGQLVAGTLINMLGGLLGGK